MLLISAMKSVFRPNELLILRLKINRDMPCPLRLEVVDFAVQLLDDIFFIPVKKDMVRILGVGR